eukprot:3951456-Pleurochrysis_carterae.AAC.3
MPAMTATRTCKVFVSKGSISPAAWDNSQNQSYCQAGILHNIECVTVPHRARESTNGCGTLSKFGHTDCSRVQVLKTRREELFIDVKTPLDWFAVATRRECDVQLDACVSVCNAQNH